MTAKLLDLKLGNNIKIYKKLLVKDKNEECINLVAQ